MQLGVKGPRNAIKAEYNYNAAAKKLASLGVNQSGDLDYYDWVSINLIINYLAVTVAVYLEMANYGLTKCTSLSFSAYDNTTSQQIG